MLQDLKVKIEEVTRTLSGNKLTVVTMGGEPTTIKAGLDNLVARASQIGGARFVVVMDKPGFEFGLAASRFPSKSVRLLVLVGNWDKFRNADCLVCSGGIIQYVHGTNLTDYELQQLRDNVATASRMYGF